MTKNTASGVFVLGNPCQIFSGKARAYPRKVPFACSTLGGFQSFIKLVLGANVIKKICPWFTDFCTKLECLLD
jgi:hypothetical protein